MRAGREPAPRVGLASGAAGRAGPREPRVLRVGLRSRGRPCPSFHHTPPTPSRPRRPGRRALSQEGRFYFGVCPSAWGGSAHAPEVTLPPVSRRVTLWFSALEPSDIGLRADLDRVKPQ